ncbi:MAG: WD40 repeat domain-containing protein [Chitinophagales bacterium]|nr:WD40 repeat domain-containing protein [Chitinophagales bacterium]
MKQILPLLLLLSGLATLHAQVYKDYKPSAAFMSYRGDSCFDITQQEGDRAFRLRKWDAAAALYRAARGCADADQKGRSVVAQKIKNCRDSAANDIIRRERQAVAGTRARDAEKLLMRYNRTLAFRLADFALSYITPDEINLDCRQAIYNAWYYNPELHTDKDIQNTEVPFNYEFAQELGDNAEVGQILIADSVYVWGINQKLNQLVFWEAQSGELRWVRDLDLSLHKRFIRSEDGRYMLQVEKNRLKLWKGKEIFWTHNASVDAAVLTADNEYVYYASKGDIYRITVAETVQQYTQKKKTNYPSRYTATRQAEKIAKDLRIEETNLWAVQGDTLWQFDGRILKVYRLSRQGENSDGFTDLGTIPLKQDMENVYNPSPIGQIHPGARVLLLEQEIYDTLMSRYNDNYIYKTKMISLRDVLGAEHLSEQPFVEMDGRFSGALFKNGFVEQVATYLPKRRLLYIRYPNGGVKYGALVPGSIDVYNDLPYGSFEPEGRFYVHSDQSGSLSVWALEFSSGEDYVNFQLGPQFGIDAASRLVYSQNEGNLYLQPFNPDLLDARRFERQIRNILGARADWVAYVQDGIRAPIVLEQFDYLGGPSAKRWELPVPPERYQQPRAAAFSPGLNKAAIIGDFAREVFIVDLSTGRAQPYNLRYPYPKDIEFVDENTLWLSYPSDEKWKSFESKLYRISGDTLLHLKFTPKSGGTLFSTAQWMPVFAVADTGRIRIFNTDDLLNEAAMLPPSEYALSAIQMNAAGDRVAAAYQDGKVIVWNVPEERAEFSMNPSQWQGNKQIKALAFNDKEDWLYMLLESGELMMRSIDLAHIRSTGQKQNRKMSAFSPAEIEKYGLEKILNYEGNFEKLTQSNDIPLLYAFINYYRSNALESGDIARIAESCERAVALYKVLEDQQQEKIKSATVEIFVHYYDQLLLRNQLPQAAKLALRMRSIFGEEKSVLFIEAKTNLLQKQYDKAAQKFTDWCLMANANQFEFYVEEVQRLMDQELLDEEQRNFLCVLFDGIVEMPYGCEYDQPLKITFTTKSRQREWELWKKVLRPEPNTSHGYLVEWYEKYYSDALNFENQNRSAGTHLSKTALARLISVCFNYANYEGNTDLAISQLQRASNLYSKADWQGTPLDFNISASAKKIIAEIYRANNQFEKVIMRFEQMIEEDLVDRDLGGSLLGNSLRFSRKDIYIPLFEAYLFQQDSTKAAETLEILKNEPLDAVVLSELALMAALKGDYPTATGHFQLACSGSTALPLDYCLGAVQKLAAAFPEKQRALDSYCRVLLNELVPDSSSAFKDLHYQVAKMERSHFYFKKGQYEEACQIARAVIETDAAAFKRKCDNTETEGVLVALWQHYANCKIALQWQQADSMQLLATQLEQRLALILDEAYNGWRLSEPYAHALLLGGRRESAEAVYEQLINSVYDNTAWALVLQRIEALRARGVRFTGLKPILEKVMPENFFMSVQEWQQIE